MTDEQSPLVPEWDVLSIPEDDSAEPDDADVAHEASVEEVEALWDVLGIPEDDSTEEEDN